MKRLVIRLGLLSIVGVLGFFAIAQAQRQEDTAATDVVAGSDAGSSDAASGAALPGVPAAQATLPGTQPAPQRLPITNDLAASNPLRDTVAAVGDAVTASDAAATGNNLPTGRPDPFGLAANAGPRPGATADAPAVGSRYASASDVGESLGSRYAALNDDAPSDAATRPTEPPVSTRRGLAAIPDRPIGALSDAGAGQTLAPAPRSETAISPRASIPAANTPEKTPPASIPAAETSRLTGSPSSTLPAATIPAATIRAAEVPAALPEATRPAAPRATLTDSAIDSAIASSRATPTRDPYVSPRAMTIPDRSGAAFGSDRPGSRNLDGPQAPNLTLEKRAPAEIQVGKSATFEITVRNTGSVSATDVQVHDHVPQGTRLLGSRPKATPTAGSGVVWSLGTMEPGDEKTLELQVMPEQEGEIGSVANVTFRAQASVRTVTTKPELQIEVTGPREVMIGEDATFKIKVTNPGTGAASGIVLFDSLPPQLQHAAGPELEFDVGTLEPKETRELELTVTAAAPGDILNVVAGRGEGSLSAQGQVPVQVIAPALQVGVEGPRRRYLEREATYTLSVSNPGTAPAREVELVSHLPKAMKFVSANNKGLYDKGKHAVYWSLEELPEGETGSVKLTAVPVEAGQHKLRVEGTAEQDLTDQTEETITVEGLAALLFEVVDVEDPVEVGGDTTYEIRVLNQGTKVANNIRITALLPKQLKPLSADGPTQSVIQGGRVVFAALPRLAPKADTTFKIRAQGRGAGDARIRVQLQSDEVRNPVTKEESTNIYADR